MRPSRFAEEQIIGMLKEQEAGAKTSEVCRKHGISAATFYKFKAKFGGMDVSDARRQIELIRTAWRDSSKVYGYRKLHDDLVDMGENCCPNRVARLARLAGIRAQIGYKRRPGMYGGKPSLAIGNTLDRQFDVEAPDKA